MVADVRTQPDARWLWVSQADGSDDGRVYALNAASGTLVWSHRTGGQVESGPAAPATINSVYVGSDDDGAYALKVAS